MIVLCAVCFQGLDAVMRDSLNAGILVLLAVTGSVLATFAYFFLRLARRAAAVDSGPAPLDDVLGGAMPGGDGHPR